MAKQFSFQANQQEYLKRLRESYRMNDGSQVEFVPSFIRSEQTIATSKSEYVFETNQNNMQKAVLNLGVDINDFFFATAIGLFISQRTIAKPSAMELLTYPDAAEITSGTPANLEVLYNAKLQFTVGQKQVLPAISTTLFRNQNMKAIAYGGSAFSTAVDNRNIADGLVDLNTVVPISGSAANKFILNAVTNGDSLVPADGTLENVLTLFAFGFTALNGADSLRRVK